MQEFPSDIEYLLQQINEYESQIQNSDLLLSDYEQKIQNTNQEINKLQKETSKTLEQINSYSKQINFLYSTSSEPPDQFFNVHKEGLQNQINIFSKVLFDQLQSISYFQNRSGNLPYSNPQILISESQKREKIAEELASDSQFYQSKLFSLYYQYQNSLKEQEKIKALQEEVTQYTKELKEMEKIISLQSQNEIEFNDIHEKCLNLQPKIAEIEKIKQIYEKKVNLFQELSNKTEFDHFQEFWTQMNNIFTIQPPETRPDTLEGVQKEIISLQYKMNTSNTKWEKEKKKILQSISSFMANLKK